MIEDQLETHMMEQDLSKFSESFFLGYNPNKTVQENVKDTFKHFSQKANLAEELTAEELAAFEQRVADEVKYEASHDNLNQSDLGTLNVKWKVEVARALEDQKPVCTKLLERVINKNNTEWVLLLVLLIGQHSINVST